MNFVEHSLPNPRYTPVLLFFIKGLKLLVWYDFLRFIKNIIMKQAGGNGNTQNKQNMNQNHKNRPEIRDNLDHREGEEQTKKGDDVTHNEKQTKEDHLKKKKK
jgi:hypothetical protein